MCVRMERKLSMGAALKLSAGGVPVCGAADAPDGNTVLRHSGGTIVQTTPAGEPLAAKLPGESRVYEFPAAMFPQLYILQDDGQYTLHVVMYPKKLRNSKSVSGTSDNAECAVLSVVILLNDGVSIVIGGLVKNSLAYSKHRNAVNAAALDVVPMPMGASRRVPGANPCPVQWGGEHVQLRVQAAWAVRGLPDTCDLGHGTCLPVTSELTDTESESGSELVLGEPGSEQSAAASAYAVEAAAVAAAVGHKRCRNGVMRSAVVQQQQQRQRQQAIVTATTMTVAQEPRPSAADMQRLQSDACCTAPCLPAHCAFQCAPTNSLADYGLHYGNMCDMLLSEDFPRQFSLDDGVNVALADGADFLSFDCTQQGCQQQLHVPQPACALPGLV